VNGLGGSAGFGEEALPPNDDDVYGDYDLIPGRGEGDSFVLFPDAGWL